METRTRTGEFFQYCRDERKLSEKVKLKPFVLRKATKEYSPKEWGINYMLLMQLSLEHNHQKQVWYGGRFHWAELIPRQEIHLSWDMSIIWHVIDERHWDVTVYYLLCDIWILTVWKKYNHCCLAILTGHPCNPLANLFTEKAVNMFGTGEFNAARFSSTATNLSGTSEFYRTA